MAGDPIRLETEQKGDWTVWRVGGRLDRMTAQAADEKGDELLASCGKLVMELSELKYLSSGGIRVLIRLAKKAKEDGTVFALCAPRGMVEAVLTETHLDVLMKIYSSIDEI